MKFVSVYLPAILFVAAGAILFYWGAPLVFLQQHLEGFGVLGYGAYVLALTAAVVFMPLTVMPLIPIAAGIFGPFVTSILSIIGWSLGAAIAFLIARYWGRPVVERFFNTENMDALIARIPSKTHFWFIVLLRLTLPVDLVSYALGLAKSLSFTSYIAATILGVTWFSFAFAYMGDALFKGNTIEILEIALVSLSVFILGAYTLRLLKSGK